MAKQVSFLKLDGSMGGVSFYQSPTDGYLAREKGGVSADRIKNDPAYERTRENNAEFGRATTAGRVLRTALRTLIGDVADSRMTSRLSAKMVQVVKADTTSARGMRNVTDGNLALANHFEFNADGLLQRTLHAAYTITVERNTGLVTITVPAFIPKEGINAPAGATHAVLVAGAAAIDFATEANTIAWGKTEEIGLGFTQEPGMNLTYLVGPNSTRPIFVALGIEFLQEVNGTRYPLNNGKFNALALIAVDLPTA